MTINYQVYKNLSAKRDLLQVIALFYFQVLRSKLKLENSLAILIHALRRIRLMLNFNLQRKPFMKCQQTLMDLSQKSTPIGETRYGLNSV